MEEGERRGRMRKKERRRREPVTQTDIHTGQAMLRGREGGSSHAERKRRQEG